MKNVLALAIYLVTIPLILLWFGWKLLVILVLFVWANNIERKI